MRVPRLCHQELDQGNCLFPHFNQLVRKLGAFLMAYLLTLMILVLPAQWQGTAVHCWSAPCSYQHQNSFCQRSTLILGKGCAGLSHTYDLVVIFLNTITMFIIVKILHASCVHHINRLFSIFFKHNQTHCLQTSVKNDTNIRINKIVAARGQRFSIKYPHHL
jgi:hypothetical protein